MRSRYCCLGRYDPSNPLQEMHNIAGHDAGGDDGRGTVLIVACVRLMDEPALGGVRSVQEKRRRATGTSWAKREKTNYCGARESAGWCWLARALAQRLPRRRRRGPRVAPARCSIRTGQPRLSHMRLVPQPPREKLLPHQQPVTLTVWLIRRTHAAQERRMPSKSTLRCPAVRSWQLNCYLYHQHDNAERSP